MHSPYYTTYHREPDWVTQPSLLRAMAVRPRMLFLVTFGMFALFAVLILNLPKGYQSRMELRLGPEDEAALAVSGDAKGVASKAAPGLESRINLEMEVLKSSDTLAQVVVATGLQKLEAAEDHRTGETTTLTVDKAVQRLQEHLKVERVGQSNLVEVSYSGPTSELAAATLQHLAAIYPKARLKVYGEPGNYKFLHRQLTVWRQQMDEAENDLVHFRRRYSEFVLPEEREALGRRTVEAQAAFEQADAQVAQYRSKVAQASAKVKALSPVLAERNAAAAKSEAVGRAVMTLMDLMGRRADLESRAPADKKLLREADERIRNARGTLTRSLTAGAGDAAVNANPVEQNAEMNLIASETELAGYQALRNRLKRVADEYKAEMFRLADAEIRDGALLRQAKQTEEQYLQYARWQEQALAKEGLAKEQIFNFGVVERPTIPMEPATPHVAADLLLLFLLSVCCGLAAVLCAEYLTPTALRRYSPLRAIPAHFETV